MDKYSQSSFFTDLEPVDNSQITNIKRKPKQKRKVIKIDNTRSLIEGNMMSSPLFIVDRKRGETGTLDIEWVDSNGVHRNMTLIASNESDLPNAKDFSVLVGILKLYSEQNPEIYYNYNEQLYDMPVRVNFTYSDIARVLGYKSCGGSVIKQIQTALRNLAMVSIRSEGGLYDPVTKQYIESREAVFKLIEYDIYKYSDVKEGEKRLDAKSMRERNYVEISSFFYNSMRHGNFKIYNYDIYRKLKRDISKQVFFIIDKWRGNKTKTPFVYYKYSTLYSRMALNEGLSENTKNMYIRRAADDLKEAGYIADYDIKPGEGIVFKFDNSVDVDLNNMNNSYLGLDNYNNFDDVVETLGEYGVPKDIIDDYVNQFNIEYVKALLRYFDVAIRYDRIEENATGFLVKGLKTPYNIPNKYYNQKKLE